jgi:hypothetical protein
VAGRADLPVRITGVEQPEQSAAAVVVEAFIGSCEEPSAAVERIVLAAAVTEGVVLHPPAALIQLGVGQTDHMERIGHLGGVGEHRS